MYDSIRIHVEKHTKRVRKFQAIKKDEISLVRNDENKNSVWKKNRVKA